MFQYETEKGNILAIHDLGKMYRNGLLGDENISKADEYFTKALQGFLEIEPYAKRLKPYIQYRIGKMYAFGYGTEQDYKKAFEYFKLSADQDNAYACYETAKMLRDGICTEKNSEQAEVYFRNAYNRFCKIAVENPDDKILYRLGVMTFNGTGCEADRERGIELVRQSADFGDEHAKMFIENMDSLERTAIQNAVTSLLVTFGRLIFDDYNREFHGQKMRTEHKLKAAIRRKKQSLGLKENSLENQQFGE